MPVRFFPHLMIICIIFHFQFTNNLFAQIDDQPGFIILEPADSTIGEFPVLKIKDREDTISKVVYDLAKNSSMHQAIRLYQLVQNFLVNAGKTDKPEPAYLLLSQHQGGFPRHGFYLLQNNKPLDKRDVSYIELVKNNPNSEDHLGSMTQIYPHEMGHVLFHLLSANSDSIVPAAVDIHYSTMCTDYATAFNEGFSIHFENVAREYEPDSNRKKSILLDFDREKNKTQLRIKPFENDFNLPLRIGFYRMMMVFWYQDFEDIKRFEWVNENRMRFKNEEVIFSDPEKSLLFRNAGIRLTNEPKNLQQMFATEGMIASFFIQLMESDLKNYSADTSISKLFTNEPQNLSPLENQYIKVFWVLNRHVHQTISEKSQIYDFVEGYIHEFPEEVIHIKAIFKSWSGYDFPVDPGPQLWLLTEKHEHGILVMDQFGGITIPMYAFNLNAATVADLMTIMRVDQKSAETVINYIGEMGPLKNLEELCLVPDVSSETQNALLQHPFDAEKFKKLDEYSVSLSVLDLLKASLLHYGKMLLIWFGIILAATILIFRFYHQKFKTKNGVHQFLRILIFSIVGLLSIILVNQPLMWFLGVGILTLAIQFLIIRKKASKKPILLSSILVVLVIAWSLF